MQKSLHLKRRGNVLCYQFSYMDREVDVFGPLSAKNANFVFFFLICRPLSKYWNSLLFRQQRGGFFIKYCISVLLTSQYAYRCGERRRIYFC